MRYREFTGTCPICGKHLAAPAWATGEFHDVCTKCFDIRFWDLIKEQVDNGDTFIMDGVAWTPGSNGVIWCNGRVPEERRAELPDNAGWGKTDETH